MTRFLIELTFDTSDLRFARVRPAHRLYWEEQAAAGLLLGGGLFRDRTGGLLLCVAADEQVMRSVIMADPLVREGVITRFHIREWTAALVPAHTGPEHGEFPPGLTLADGSGPLIPRIESGPGLVRSSALADLSRLTAHEQRIARLMLLGKTNREIAAAFKVSARAVELHITSMYRKLGIRRRAQLAKALGNAA